VLFHLFMFWLWHQQDGFLPADHMRGDHLAEIPATALREYTYPKSLHL
jgi:hypothetical protein